MINKNKIIIAAIALAGILVGAVGIANANPIYVAPTVQTNIATTSPAYIGVGTATSTLTYDSYSNPTANKFLPTKVAVGFQFMGSSTSAVLTAAIEYSNDGIDWYRNTVVDPNSIGTTSAVTSLNTTQTYTWTYSSTENVGGKTGANATTTRMILVPTPTRYMRVIESMTGAGGAVWTQIMPIKELY